MKYNRERGTWLAIVAGHNPPPSGLTRASSILAVSGGILVYIPNWEWLNDALKRVMESGLPEQEAKLGICLAIADGKIKVRPTVEFLTQSPNDTWLNHDYAADYRNYVHRLFARTIPLDLPWHLKPSDFNWIESCFELPRLFEPGYEGFPGPPRTALVRVELLTADVIDTLCSQSTTAPPPVELSSKAVGAKAGAIRQAVNQLWPLGIPTGLSAKERNAKLLERIEINQGSKPIVSPRTIERTIKEMREVK